MSSASVVDTSCSSTGKSGGEAGVVSGSELVAVLGVRTTAARPNDPDDANTDAYAELETMGGEVAGAWLGDAGLEDGDAGSAIVSLSSV